MAIARSAVPDNAGRGDAAGRVGAVQSMLDRRTSELVTALRQLNDVSEHILEALVAALDARERETSNHSSRVARNTVLLARAMGIDGTSCACCDEALCCTTSASRDPRQRAPEEWPADSGRVE